MPPKKKQGKKSGKKSGKAKKGKNKEPEITFQEAVLAYKIGLVEKQIEDWKFEENNLEEQKERLAERNERLLEEQAQYCKIMLKQSREFEKNNLSADKVGKTHVMNALNEKWEACKAEEAKLEEMHRQILELERTIIQTKNEKHKWLDYKNVGSIQRQQQIELLEKEIKDMEQSYVEISEHLSRNLEISRERIEEHLDKTLDTEKHHASEKAMATLDKKGRQEVLDNDWMKVEVLRYEKQCDEILAEVEEIERENLALMSELFENNVNILKITRGLFLTQFEDSESLRDGGILEVDLKQVSLLNRDTDKVTQPPLKAASSDEQDSEEEYFDEYYDDEPLTPTSDTEDPFNNYYNFQDEDITEYLKLGPLQLKLLTISGEQKPIYVQGGSSKAEIQAREFNPVDWPVTQPMMKSVTTPRPNVY